MNDKIVIGHGSGGKLTHELVETLFLTHFNNGNSGISTDSAILQNLNSTLAFTTDSYVIDPIIFPGGNIGKLAICGTINDLAVSGAIPKYISASFIIEEGLLLNDLEDVVKAMANEAINAGITIVTGDTKVVNKGKCDKLFINTAGIGIVNESCLHIAVGTDIQEGDKIILSGNIGDHSIAILSSRESIKFETDIKSDCACLHKLTQSMLFNPSSIKFMRDVTRGGLATVLCEVAALSNKGIEINEKNIPINPEVLCVCDAFGYDPLYLANEGKLIAIVSASNADEVLASMKNIPEGNDAAIIGEIVNQHSRKVVMKTHIGGRRILDMLAGEQLPRIC